jgi:hypothetical protein
MALTVNGLTIGDDGTGFVVPTYSEIREALARRYALLTGGDTDTSPGSDVGNMIDMHATTVDMCMQAIREDRVARPARVKGVMAQVSLDAGGVIPRLLNWATRPR